MHSQFSECTCRAEITKHQGQFRIETRYFCFPRVCKTHATANSRSFCIQALTPTSLVDCLETRPGEYSTRCVLASLGREIRFRFSFIQLVKSCSKEDCQKKIGHLIIVTPTCQIQSWYAKFLKMSVPPPILLPQIRYLLTNLHEKITL